MSQRLTAGPQTGLVATQSKPRVSRTPAEACPWQPPQLHLNSCSMSNGWPSDKHSACRSAASEIVSVRASEPGAPSDVQHEGSTLLHSLGSLTQEQLQQAITRSHEGRSSMDGPEGGWPDHPYPRTPGRRAISRHASLKDLRDREETTAVQLSPAPTRRANPHALELEASALVLTQRTVCHPAEGMMGG